MRILCTSAGRRTLRGGTQDSKEDEVHRLYAWDRSVLLNPRGLRKSSATERDGYLLWDRRERTQAGSRAEPQHFKRPGKSSRLFTRLRFRAFVVVFPVRGSRSLEIHMAVRRQVTALEIRARSGSDVPRKPRLAARFHRAR